MRTLAPMMMRMLMCVGFGAMSCASTQAGFAQINLSDVPTQGSYPGEALVQLVDEVDVYYRPGDGGKAVAVVVERRTVAVLTSCTEDTWGASYWPEFETIESISLRITTPDGKSRVLGAKERFDGPARSGGGLLFTQDRVIGYRTPPLAAGSLVEFVVQKTTTHPERSVEQQYFASSLRTLRAELKATAAPGFTIEHQLAGERDDAIRVSDAIVGGQQQVRYVRTDLPPRSQQPDEPSFWLWWPRAWVRVGTYLDGDETKHSPSDAAQVSRIEHGLSQERTLASESIHALHATIVAGMPAEQRGSARERARTLYAWVQANIQYCALYESALGGFVPHPAALIAEQRSGDCKDKAALLSSLLQVDGTPNRLAVVFSHDGYPRRYEVPALFHNFNHMIIVVDLPEGSVVADPTTRSIAFGRLPDGDQGADLLPISAQGDGIFVTAMDPPEAHRLEVDYDLVLKDTWAHGTVKVTLTGNRAASFREEFLSTPTEQHAERLAERLSLEAPIIIRNVRISGLAYDGNDTPVTATAEVWNTPLLLGGNSPRPLLDVEELLFDGLGTVPAENGGPSLLSARGVDVIRVRIRVPDVVRIDSLPDARDNDSAFASIHQSWRIDPGNPQGLLFERTLTRHRTFATAQERADLRKAYQSVRQWSGYVQLAAKGVKP